jgi:putative membrane protein
MAVMMAVFWGAIVAVIVLLMRGRPADQGPQAPTRPTSREILDERFARGEIDREEYEDRRAALQG